MKHEHIFLKALVLGCLITFNIDACFAGYPQAYYNQAPNYNQQPIYNQQQQQYYNQQPNYDQQQDYNDNQQRFYNMEPFENEMMTPMTPPSSQQEIIMQAPSPMHVWMPGYWNWQNRWIWIPGQWSQPPRPNAEWMEHQWRQHEDDERYRMERGEWR